MDNVNIESTLSYNERFEKNLIEEMDNITFEYDGLSGEGEKLLQILNYSPKVIKSNRDSIKNLKIIEIPQLSELSKLDFSKLDIIPKQRNNTKINQMIKNLLISIIDNIINNIKEEKKSQKEIKLHRLFLEKINSYLIPGLIPMIIISKKNSLKQLKYDDN